MSTNVDFDRHAAAWLADGPTELSDRVLDAALREVHLTRQRNRWSAPWRTTVMSMRIGLAAALTVIALLGIFAFNLMGGGGPPPLSTALPEASTAAAAPTASAAARSTLDPGAWPTYTSAEYAFTIRHPVGWSVLPATRAWAFGTDTDAGAPRSPGADHFTSPTGDVRISAWAVPLDPGLTIDTWPGLESWVTTWCQQTGRTDCSLIRSRAIPMCNEHRDCHPALLVVFEGDVEAFFTGGSDTGRVVVAAVWQGDAAPQTAEYGGSRALLEAVLSTMDVVPATMSAEIRDAAATFVATGR